RQEGRGLVVGHEEPRRQTFFVARVATIPIRRRVVPAIFGGATLGFGLSQQGFIMFLRGLERVWRNDVLTRNVAIAIAPWASYRRIIAHDIRCVWVCTPDGFKSDGARAAEVTRI